MKKTEIAKTETAPVKTDSLAALLTDKKDTTAGKKGNNPLIDKIVAQGGGPVLGVFNTKDTAVINGYFKRPDIKILLQGNQRYAKFVWGKPAVNTNEKTKKKLRL